MYRHVSTGDTIADKKNEIVVSIDASIEDLIPDFLNRKREAVSQLHELLERGDYEGLADLGHGLTGVSGAFGFIGLAEIGRSLQLAAAKMDQKEARRLAEELSSYLERVTVVYD